MRRRARPRGGKRQASVRSYLLTAAGFVSIHPSCWETNLLEGPFSVAWRRLSCGSVPDAVAARLQRTGRHQSHLEQVAQLEEKSIFRPLESGLAHLGGISERTPVAGEEHGSGRRLVGEQNITPERAVAKGPGSGVQVGCRIEHQDRGVGSRLIPQRIAPFSGVLPHQPEKDRPGELIFDLEPRTSPDAHRAAVRTTAHKLEVVLSIYPQLVGRPPVENQIEPGDVGTGPFIEIFVVTPEEENVSREM